MKKPDPNFNQIDRTSDLRNVRDQPAPREDLSRDPTVDRTNRTIHTPVSQE